MSAFAILAAAARTNARGALSAYPTTGGAGEPWLVTSPVWNYDAETPVDFSAPDIAADVRLLDAEGATVLATPTQITFAGTADGTFTLAADEVATAALRPGEYVWGCLISDGVDTIPFWAPADSPFVVTATRSLTAAAGVITTSQTVLVRYIDTHDDAPAQVTFTVNGATSTVDLTHGVAELEVTPTGTGEITVTVDQDIPATTITVQEA